MSFTLPYKWITAEELAELIKSRSQGEVQQYAVVDVRDSDFVGGNIVQALNYPSDTFHASVDDLVKRLGSVPKVIFHCALSQARGPKAARIYGETRQTQLPDGPAQEILVLREGFSGFQAKFRNDPELIEKFSKYYHD